MSRRGHHRSILGSQTALPLAPDGPHTEAFHGPECLAPGRSFRLPPGQIGLGVREAAGLGQGDAMDDGRELTMAATIEAMAYLPGRTRLAGSDPRAYA